ncbi:MAG: site-specific integrase [Stellaceae bacterium]
MHPKAGYREAACIDDDRIIVPCSCVLTSRVSADQRSPHIVPALVADLGDEVARRYVEFFTANIRNSNTRRAYVRACNRFLGWCEDRGLALAAIRPHDVATYVEELQHDPGRLGCGNAAGLVFFLFDLLHLDGDDIGARPLIERKARLAALLSNVAPPLHYTDYHAGDGQAFHAKRRQPHLASGQLLRL